MLIHYPPQLSKIQERMLRHLIDDWAVAHGLTMRTGEGDMAVHAPVTFFPSPFSKSGFEEALRIQTAFNELYHQVAQHSEWLLGVLDEVAKYDDFTRQLIRVHRCVPAGKRTQRLTGGLFRSDYLVNRSRTNDEGRQIKQVEFNTISVSFGGLSTRVTELHRFLADTNRGGTLVHGDIPHSPSLKDLAAGLATMHSAYLYSRNHGGAYAEGAWQDSATETLVSEENVFESDEEGSSYRDAGPTPRASSRPTPELVTPRARSPSNEAPERNPVAVLLVYQPGEKNVIDQRLLEFELFERHNIVTHRITLGEVEQKLTVNEENRLMFLPTGNEISVVYYRSGYSPDDYPTEKEWDARLMLESSHAVQCPSVLTQLAGSKKIQQLLADVKILAAVAPDLEQVAIDRLTKTFVEMYPLDDSERGRIGRRLAFESPERFVLKPQREGGGNNVYRDDIVDFLNRTPRESWGAYILMELIESPRMANKILRRGEIYSGRVVNELGVFGTILWDTQTGTTLHNEQAGWLLRTKLQDSDEGGIAAGFGCLDSVLLNAR